MNITNDKVTAYINGLYQPIDPDLEKLRQEAEAQKVPILLRDTETFLMNLMRIKNPASVLEIGTAVGYSAACMARCCPHCMITTVEADEKMYEAAERNIAGLGLTEQIRLIAGKGQEALKELTGSFDLVFIDAAKSHYRTFWDLALPLCSPRAVIVCDNVLMKGMTVSDEYDPNRKYKTSIRRMREFLLHITKTAEADTSVMPVGDGVSLSVLKG